jgi:hypothetical protein
MPRGSGPPSSWYPTESTRLARPAGGSGSCGLPVTGVAQRGYLKVISACHQGIRVDGASDP